MRHNGSLGIFVAVGIAFRKVNRLEAQIGGDLFEFAFGLADILILADIDLFFRRSLGFFQADAVVDRLTFFIGSRTVPDDISLADGFALGIS